MKKIHLTIPQPCHENWDQMTPRDKGRFCASCQKTVVDFSAMSDRQIAEFFKKPVSSVCGHFAQDQLDRDIDMARKRIPWIKYFFQFSLPAMLISAKATAQGQIAVRGDTVCIVPDSLKSKQSPKVTDENLVEGKISDRNGNPVPYANIMVKGTKNGVVADSMGAFQIMVKPGLELEISSVGFVSQTIIIRDFSKMMIVLETAYSQFMVGVIVATSHKKKNREQIPVIKRIVDTAFKNFTVYPNPAHRHSSLKIDCSKLENGDYVLSVIDMGGEVIHTEEIVLHDKRKSIEFYLENASPGTYIVHLFHRKTAASSSEKIIIQ